MYLKLEKMAQLGVGYLTITCIFKGLSFFFSQDELKKIEYHKVYVRGEFLHDKIVYLGPKSLLQNDPLSRRGGIFSDPNKSGLGYHVVTPFKLENRQVCCSFKVLLLLILGTKCIM